MIHSCYGLYTEDSAEVGIPFRIVCSKRWLRIQIGQLLRQMLNLSVEHGLLRPALADRIGQSLGLVVMLQGMCLVVTSQGVRLATMLVTRATICPSLTLALVAILVPHFARAERCAVPVHGIHFYFSM